MTGARVIAPGPAGWGTTLLDVASGEEIKGVRAVRINIEPDNLIQIEADIFAEGIDVNGNLTLYIVDPCSGETKCPTRIEYDDGTAWERGA